MIRRDGVGNGVIMGCFWVFGVCFWVKLSLFLVFTFFGGIGGVVTDLEDIVFFLWWFWVECCVGVAGVLCGCWLALLCGFFGVGLKPFFCFWGIFFNLKLSLFLEKAN